MPTGSSAPRLPPHSGETGASTSRSSERRSSDSRSSDSRSSHNASERLSSESFQRVEPTSASLPSRSTESAKAARPHSDAQDPPNPLDSSSERIQSALNTRPAPSSRPVPSSQPTSAGTPTSSLRAGTKPTSGVRQTATPLEPGVRGFALQASSDSGELIGGRFRVEGFLGEGGTASVYLARDLQTSELVVVKRMKPQIATVPELKLRFVLEAKALASVHHPAVVRIKSIEEPEGEPPFLTLEALRGETLGDYLKREELMAVDTALFLLRYAAIALEAVHSAGIIHRDIKPDNLFLLGPQGAPEGLKVLDFGMALLADEAPQEDSTSILGTAQYMAPEQILVETVDERTDIYALGVVMFRMLTGHLPFDAQSKKDLLRHQLFSPVPPATWLNEDLSAGLVRIIHKCTRKSPALRYPSMRALLNAIDQLGDHGDAESWTSDMLPLSRSLEPDVYEPRTERGRQAAAVLAKEFGVYARPHSQVPPRSDDSSWGK